MGFVLSMILQVGMFLPTPAETPPDSVVYPTFKYYVWIPDPKHVDNKITQQNWMVANYLQAHQAEFEPYGKFEIIDTNDPRFRYNEDGKVISSHSYRSGAGPIQPLAIRINSPGELVRYIRYAMQLTQAVLQQQRPQDDNQKNYNFSLGKVRLGTIPRVRLWYSITTPRLFQRLTLLEGDVRPGTWRFRCSLQFPGRYYCWDAEYSTGTFEDGCRRLDHGTGILLDLLPVEEPAELLLPPPLPPPLP